jgi:hypothetical protein
LFEGAAVEYLQGVDFGLVLFQVVAEGLDQRGGFGFGGGIEALAEDGVHGGGVDGLLGVLFGVGQGVAQGRDIVPPSVQPLESPSTTQTRMDSHENRKCCASYSPVNRI